MVALRDKVARPPLTVDYDPHADVLYVALGYPAADEGEDRPRGVVLRYSVKDNVPTGATIIGFVRNRWDRHIDELSEIVGVHLGVDRTGVLKKLEEATKR